ncbi:MAG: phage tail terminator-like protein [Acinetobacter sp.]
MAMTIEQARQAIIARMVAFTGIEQKFIRYPNKTFTPPESGLWCHVNIIYGRSMIAGLADTPLMRRTGNLNIQCFARKNTGDNALTILGDALLAHFEAYRFDQLEFTSGEVIDAGEDDDFVQYNVVIGFRVN